jgi:hypothetical protein
MNRDAERQGGGDQDLRAERRAGQLVKEQKAANLMVLRRKRLWLIMAAKTSRLSGKS